MQRSNSGRILGTVHSTPTRRAGLAALAVALLLCAGSLVGERRIFPGGALRALEAAPQGNGAQIAAPTVSALRHAQFRAPREVSATFNGPTRTAELLATGAVRPLSLATEDFNQDGWPDLVAGYATSDGDGVAVLYFGDREAYAPEKPETLADIAQNRSPVPFLSEARSFSLPEAPDFLAAGDFNRGGNPGLLVGARGSEQLYILAGDGHGHLGAPQGVPLPGTLTALATGHIGRGDSSLDVAVGVEGRNGPELLIFKGGLSAPPVVYSLDAVATSLKIGNLDDDPYGDVAILAGGSLFILHGQLWGPGSASGHPRSAAPELESVPVSSDVTAFAIGDFIWERNDRMEIAALTGGEVQILSRGTPDKHPFTVAQIRAARQAMAQLRLARLRAGTPLTFPPAWRPGATQPWQVAQTITVGSAASASDLEAVTTALPDRAPQSVLLVDASASQLHLLTEPPGVTNANPNFGSESSMGSPNSTGVTALPSTASWSHDVIATGGAPAAILPMRVNVSAQPGLVTLKQGQVTPLVSPAVVGDPITVDRTDDDASASACTTAPNDCSLRGAIIYANAHSGTTINIPTGTYTLTIGGDDDPSADPTYGDLDINASMTIVGAGAATTIIQANFPVVDGQDGKIFGVNQLGNVDGAQVSISGLTLENARNSVGNNDPTFSQTGGAADFFLTGTSANYTLSNDVIQDNTNVHSYGGGIDIDSGGDNAGSNHGTVTISHCTIVGNTTQSENSTSGSGANCAGSCAGSDGHGGGIRLGADIHDVVITNSTISGNQTSAGGSPTQADEGGGIWILHTNGGTISIHNTRIGDSVNGGNQSAGRGGGISMGAGVSTTTLTIDQGSFIQHNVSGTLSSGTAEGGGIYIAGVVSTSLNQVTITGNSLSSSTSDHRGGGGIAVGDVTSPVTISYSRIVGNSASSSTGIGLHKDNQSGTVTATDNWWGCNGGPSAGPCDTAVLDSAPGILSFNPWLVLSLSPSTAQSVQNLGTISLTADLNHDSNGSTVGSNIPNGISMSFGTTGGIGSDNPVNTTTTGGTGSSLFTASSVGSGTVKTTVDHQTDSTTVAVYVPVTIASSPSGKSFTVTGATPCAAGSYTTPQILNWSATSCTVQFTSPVSNGTGAQLTFSDWADDSDTNNPRTITIPASPTTFTADFVQQYQLTTAVSPGGGGTVTTPASGTFLNSGSATTLTATANSGFIFNNWSVTSGSATFGNASLASTTVKLSSGPATVQANFLALVSVTFASKLDGSTSTGLAFSVSGTGCQPGSHNTQQVLAWTPGSTCTVTFTTPQGPGSGTQYVFTQWDDNASTSNSRIFSVPASATTYTADFTTQYQLTTAVNLAGAGTVAPSTPTYYNKNSTPAIQATTNAGYAFTNWTSTGGAVTSSTSASTTVTMSAPTTATANFIVHASTTTVLTSSSNPSVYGHSVTFTATVSSGGLALTAGTGTVTFTDTTTSTTLATAVPLNSSGRASVAISTLSAGISHIINATYNPDLNHVTSSATESLSVNTAPLTVTAGSTSMKYGGIPPAVTPIYTGFRAGDTAASLTTPPTCVTTATSSTPVGTDTGANTCSGAASVNYNFTYVPGNVTVGKASLTITASSTTMSYGSTPPAVTPLYSPFAGSDTVASLTTPPTCTTTATSSTLPGTYLGANTCSGAVDGNYNFIYATGNAKVGKASLTITASSTSMTYGGTPPAVTALYSAFAGSDTAASLTTLPTCKTTATSSTPAGTDTGANTCSGAVDSNYTITYVPGNVAIGMASLTITANSTSMTYGQTPPTVTPLYSGFVAGNTAGSLTTRPTCTTTATSSTPVQTNTGANTCSGAVDGNYHITYVPGDMTVGKASLTITASSVTMSYGATPPAVTPLYSAFAGSDTAASLTTAPTCTTTVTISTPVGTYAGANTCSGAVDGNYNFIYTPGNAKVGKASLTITASSTTMTYGGTPPSVTPLYSAFAGSDTAASLTTLPTCKTTATSSTPAGTATGANTCQGAVDSNYTFTYVPGNVTVGMASLTITASSTTMSYGRTPPAVTPLYSTFAGTDTVSRLTTPPTCTTTATSSTPVGTDTGANTCSGAVDGNYNFTYLTGNMTVNKANSTAAVTSSQNPSVFGQSVTFTATVSEAAPGTGTPTGSVTFLDTGSPIGTTTLSGGVATFTTSALAVGSHTIGYSYTGDTNFNSRTGSMSGNPQVVTKASTLAQLHSSSNPGVYGHYVLFTATVSAGGYALPAGAGTVTFIDTATSQTLATAVPLNSSGHASVNIRTLSAGIAHIIQATYNPDSNHLTSSATESFSVNRAPLTIQASSTSMKFGGTPPAVTPIYFGFTYGDTAAVLTTLPTCTTTATSSTPVGTDTGANTCSGAVDVNFNFTYVLGNVTVTAP